MSERGRRSWQLPLARGRMRLLVVGRARAMKKTSVRPDAHLLSQFRFIRTGPHGHKWFPRGS
eukprot:7142287-Pyramimonas_sp.AAC.1